MIRVLHVLDTIMSGGVERRRLSLAKLLDNTKFELKILCAHAAGPFPDEFAKYGVEVIVIGDLHSVVNVKQHKKVMKVIDDYKPHIIHGAVFEGITMASINGFFKRVPIIILEETSDPQNRRWKGHLLLKLLSLPADKFIGVSPSSTDYLVNTLKISKNKVQLINNGVITPEAINIEKVNAIKKQFNISEDQIIIGSVGRMAQDEHKRYSDLIKAFALLVNKGLKVKLMLVSGGKLIDTYKKLASELGIEDDVIFTGYQNETSNYYYTFDIFSLVSAYEAFGLVLAEAMLHKLPIVATRVGGMRYIVEDNKTGFLVEKYNVQEIAAKLELLCNDINLRKTFGQNGYERAMENYTEERYVKDIESLYLELIKQKKVKI
ncbi:MAG: glycosyltransferase family 4 protein [Flavobacterium sp.]|uniref:glycosyltransferase family 4 protein n=1 Tax=Flavobacterium sp. TaxID=239 RepID=UPI003266F81A